MKRIRTQKVLFCLLVTFQLLYGQDDKEILLQATPVVVTALRTPLQLSALNRSVDVLDATYYREKLGAVVLEDVLQRVPSLSLQSRSPFGVQTDISIRGTLFSQQLVLLNGSRLNDPQTAHHTMTIPVGIEQVDRVEVVKGPLSVLYGADAYGGVINVVTKAPEEESLGLSLRGGQYGFFSASASHAFVGASVASSTVGEYRRSEGYRSGTEFQISSLSNSTYFPLLSGKATVTSGYIVKDFGAADFYGPAPSKERTETFFLQASAVSESSVVQWQPRFFYRRNFDRFQYNRHIPDRFINTHTSHVLSAEIQGTTHLNTTTTLLFGTEGTADRIASSNLGDHRRFSLGTFVSFFTRIAEVLNFDGGVRGDLHSTYSAQFTSAFNVSYMVMPATKLYGSIGKSFRAPSYTELYYTSPSRIGNANLQPEEGWSYEIGTLWFSSPTSRFVLSGFQREQRNLIDYVKRTTADVAYSAMNFTKAVTRGLEVQWEWRSLSSSWIEEVQVGYGYLDSRIDRGNVFTSLYTFTHPRHQVNSHIVAVLPYHCTTSVGVLHKVRTNHTTTTLIDARLTYLLSQFSFIVQGTNLLDETYEEVPGVLLPGRWLWAGIDVKLW